MKKLFFSILFCVQLFFLYGQNNNEKILLVRGDDMGSSHSANLACIESYKNGIMQSVELMVPGPWFPEAVKKLNENPGMDTSEMQAIGHKGYENVAADRDAVIKVFTSSEVKSAIKKNNIILVSYSTAAKIALLTTHYAYSQQVSGVVTAFKTYPLNNASIRSLKSEKVVKTDSLGIFAIERADGDILLISASGFISQKVKVREASRIYIDLKYAFGETSFRDAVNNGHLTNNVLEEALRKYPGKGLKDYSRYQNIYELIRNEFRTVRVVGTNVYNTMAISFSMSAQVLYVVDNMVVSDISFVSPSEVKKIEFLEGPYASEYGVRGANGIIKITLSYK